MVKDGFGLSSEVRSEQIKSHRSLRLSCSGNGDVEETRSGFLAPSDSVCPVEET